MAADVLSWRAFVCPNPFSGHRRLLHTHHRLVRLHIKNIPCPRNGRTVAKAMDTFDLDPARWPELAADRGAWRTMLRSGEAPLGFRQAPPPPVPI